MGSKDTPRDTDLFLNGAEILALGEKGEKLVGGKNYNMAILSQIKGIRVPSFRAISSKAFHMLLDQTQVNAELIRRVVNREFKKVDWSSEEVTEDPDFLRSFVRAVAAIIRQEPTRDTKTITLRSFIDIILDSFVTSHEDLDALRLRSILVQTAILSVELPKEISEIIRHVHQEMTKEAGVTDLNLAVRSSAAGEDSRKKAFAGLQDTYLNIRTEDAAIQAYQWDCASAYNFRSLSYRRECILDAIREAEAKGDASIAERARKEWGIQNTSLSVCLMRMVDPVLAGTAFSADTATGFQGGLKQDLVSIDASWGIGEAIVGGIVTPDKYLVYQRDDGREVILKTMGYKNKQYVYDADRNGTVLLDVPEEDIFKWCLTADQAEAIARGVRLIRDAYHGIIMDTEFVIDHMGRLWFVQARPETRWNEIYERMPDTIMMRRMEVDPLELQFARVLLEGNGASRGAGSGIVRFLNSALELNKINPGDILAADRTDPDMVPGMRIASAILAAAGGDTSHAAITSRELGIPAVIGIRKTEALRALEGASVTVDGSRGLVYEGILSLQEYGEDIEIRKIPSTRTNIGLILADVGQAMVLSRLRNIPGFEVGLLRAEFMLGNIGAHPSALEAYDLGTLRPLIEARLETIHRQLDDRVLQLLRSGGVSIVLDLRRHVAVINDVVEEMQDMDREFFFEYTTPAAGGKATTAKLYELLERRVEEARKHLTILKITPNLREHIGIVTGLRAEITNWEQSGRPEAPAILEKLNKNLDDLTEQLSGNPELRQVIQRIENVREEVAVKSGLKEEIDRLNSLEGEIAQLIRSKGCSSGKELYIQALAQQLALFALCFQGRDVIYRTTDYKTNEYRNLLGGSLFEFHEDNPMIGYRGIGRGIHDWEFEAYKTARKIFGAKNLHIMFPFCRTMAQIHDILHYMEKVHNLKSNQDGLKVILMSEIPANAILAKEFIRDVDGFSIGSNDMTQLVLGTDRDNANLREVYDEEDPAVVWAILTTIFAGHKQGKKVGFCGQGVANSEIIRGIVAIAGITSASVVPDTYFRTKMDVAQAEAEEIPIQELGGWISRRMVERLVRFLLDLGMDEDFVRHKTADELQAMHLQEKNRFLRKIKDTKDPENRDAYRFEYRELVRRDKMYIYATWNWNQTVLDALRSGGFETFEEFEESRGGKIPARVPVDAKKSGTRRTEKELQKETPQELSTA